MVFMMPAQFAADVPAQLRDTKPDGSRPVRLRYAHPPGLAHAPRIAAVGVALIDREAVAREEALGRIPIGELALLDAMLREKALHVLLAVDRALAANVDVRGDPRAA